MPGKEKKKKSIGKKKIYSFDRFFVKKKSKHHKHHNHKDSKENVLITNIYEQQANGIGGGIFASGSWMTRVLNTINGNANVILNNDNTFTLQPGTYIINEIY